MVGAGSIVTKDVEPYSIVLDAPARHLKYRFSEPVIDALLSVKWWEWPEEKIKKLRNILSSSLTAENLQILRSVKDKY